MEKLHSAAQMFMKAEYVRELPVKKSCIVNMYRLSICSSCLVFCFRCLFVCFVRRVAFGSIQSVMFVHMVTVF